MTLRPFGPSRGAGSSGPSTQVPRRWRPRREPLVWCSLILDLRGAAVQCAVDSVYRCLGAPGQVRGSRVQAWRAWVCVGRYGVPTALRDLLMSVLLAAISVTCCYLRDLLLSAWLAAFSTTCCFQHDLLLSAWFAGWLALSNESVLIYTGKGAHQQPESKRCLNHKWPTNVGRQVATTNMCHQEHDGMTSLKHIEYRFKLHNLKDQPIEQN